MTRRYFCSALALISMLFAAQVATAQKWLNSEDGNRVNRSMFRPLDDMPTPNDQRSASGKPGPKYWQQRADHDISVALDTTTHKLTGSERVTYYNNSPDELTFLWLQLDQNISSIEHSRTYKANPALPMNMSVRARRFIDPDLIDGGYTISRVQLVDAAGKLVDAKYYINGTVMKITLTTPLKPNGKVQFEIDWSFVVPDPGGANGRGAKEKVRDGWLYEVAQWFPRMCVYDDVNGWQTDQFFGTGEFYTQFGNYDVKITVPYNHIVDATGVLQNPEECYTAEQRRRLKEAYQSETPKFIIFADEVMKPETRPKQSGTITWHFKAQNVRDFAFISSKTYVFDAAGFKYDAASPVVACHSLYPREAMPLWDKVSTKAIIQTMKTYGRMALPYPYPKAVNAHGPVFGMEYPMICFCGARPAPDGSYSQQLENALVAVTIHEVGHNWFPMIINSDERKYGWQDEGINSFLEHYACLDWNPKFPSRALPKFQTDYMRDPDQVPIMTHADLVHKGYGPQSYTKPAAGLIILRESILTPEVFDDAFRDYCKAWAFKHPQPADFFRTINQAAGEDLSWFWRGWFYTTYYNDQAIADVSVQVADSLLPGSSQKRGKNYYRIKIKNDGGLLLPVQMELTYSDSSKEMIKLPADIWRKNEQDFTKGFFTNKEVVRVVLDPNQVLADVNTSNNVWDIRIPKAEIPKEQEVKKPTEEPKPTKKSAKGKKPVAEK